VVRGEKNQVLNSLLELVQAQPDESFWEVDPERTQRVLDERAGRVVSRRPFRMADNEVVVKVDGEPTVIAFEPDNPKAMRTAKALQGMDKSQIGPFVSVFQRINRYGFNFYRKQKA